MRRVVALEGLPFTGKTTSIAHVVDHDPTWTPIVEYHALLSPALLRIHSTRPQTSEIQRQRVGTNLEVDVRRWEHVHATQEAGFNAVLDRCHVSILAYAAALDSCYGIGDPSGVARLYQRHLADSDNPITYPDEVILLKARVDIITERIQRLGRGIDHDLTTRAFIEALTDNYHAVVEALPCPVRTIDADQPLAAIQHAVLQILQETV